MSRILRALAAAAVTLSLASCDVLFDGYYSAEISQATAIADLSAVVPASSAATFNLSILKSGSDEYVLLYSSVPFDSTQNHLVVLSPGLAVLKSFTGDDISLLPPGGVAFSGSSAVTHLTDGHIVIGNVDSIPSPGGLTLLSTLNSVTLSGPTIVGPASAPFTWTNFNAGPSNLTWSVYNNAWVPLASVSQPLGKQVQLRGVFTDPESSQHNVALLVFDDSSSDTQYFIQVPKDPDIVNGLFGPPLFNNPAYTAFTKTGLGSGDIFATSDSIVGYESNSRSWLRFAPSNPDAVTRLYTGNRKQDLKTAFSFSGGYYCTWDPDLRTLTRHEDWW